MKLREIYTLRFGILFLILCFCFILSISLGSIAISPLDTLRAALGLETHNESYSYIIWNYRIPKALTAILAGSGLALNGLLMQTLFRNPLAGPFVLGISSGASLGAAILIMGLSLFSGILSSAFFNDASLVLASSLGSFLVLSLVIAVASRLKDTMALLIIGLMFGSITAAVVSVLSYFSNAEKLQQYVFWTFGSLGDVSWMQILILAITLGIGIALSVASIKSLNGYLLGENYAQSLGINLKKSRFLIIIATGILAGSITAFTGPIAFIGLAVPHFTRQIFNTTNHKILVPAVILYGSIVLLLCDIVAQLPGQASVLPLNAVTSIIGAPVVIWLLLRKRKMVF